MADVKDAARNTTDSVKDATNGATGTLREQTVSAFTGAAKDILGPALQQLSEQAATQAATFAKEQGPKLVKEQLLPQVMKSAGVDNPADLAKVGVSKAGEAISGAGGITGLAGKVMSKIGGGKGGKKAAATGYGQGRRIMIQQHQYIPVNVKDCFRAWTESEWPEFMHRVNTLDRQIEEEDARYSIGIKGFWFKKNFTAQVQEQVPFKHIVWSTTQGNIKNTGRVSFFEQGEDLTLMILNLDMAPSGLKEKWVRGFRYHKRGVRSDFHRFSAWLQMRTPDQLLDMEGWLGTIEGGKITQSHEEYVEEHEEEQDRAEKAAEQAEDAMKDQYMPDDEDEEDEERDEDEDDDEDDAPTDQESDADADEREDDEDTDDADEDEPEDGYDEMSVAALRATLRERGLSPKGARGVLVDRLRGDDDDEEADDERPAKRRRTASRR